MNKLDKQMDLDAHVAKIMDVLQHTDDRYVIVEQGLYSDADRGAALKAAYATAKTMSPTKDSPVWVLIPPGSYDVGSTGLIIDAEWVNIAGIVPAKAANVGKADMVLEPTVLVYGDVSDRNSGVVKQTADNVCIRDLEIKSTAKEVIRKFDSTDPAAYWPKDGVAGTSLRRVKIIGYNYDARGAMSWATRFGVEYAQTFDECLVIGLGCIGGYCGTLSGNLIKCSIVGAYSVCGHYGTVSGKLAGCAISGMLSVGGYYGKVSGEITDCEIKGYCCVGGCGGTVSGTLSGCTIKGEGCVGGDYGIFSGTIVGCKIIGDYSIGSRGTVSETARLTDVEICGRFACFGSTVSCDAEFVRVSGVPADLPTIGGKYLSCRLDDGTLFSNWTTLKANN